MGGLADLRGGLTPAGSPPPRGYGPAHIYILTLTHTHSHTYTHTRTHTHLHTHTYTLTLTITPTHTAQAFIALHSRTNTTDDAQLINNKEYNY